MSGHCEVTRTDPQQSNSRASFFIAARMSSKELACLLPCHLFFFNLFFALRRALFGSPRFHFIPSLLSWCSRLPLSPVLVLFLVWKHACFVKSDISESLAVLFHLGGVRLLGPPPSSPIPPFLISARWLTKLWLYVFMRPSSLMVPWLLCASPSTTFSCSIRRSHLSTPSSFSLALSKGSSCKHAAKILLAPSLPRPP